MQVAVVVESVLGNTRAIGEEVAGGLRDALPESTVSLLRVAEAGPDVVAAADLLVVGGPTHAFSMTTSRTREGALRDLGGDGVDAGAAGDGVREWLARLPDLGGTPVAAFDTRVRMPLPGHAAPAIAKQLRRRGGRLVADPEGFHVHGKEGPLLSGEGERARAWGAGLAQVTTT